jgi:hypothetical protein
MRIHTMLFSAAAACAFAAAACASTETPIERRAEGVTNVQPEGPTGVSAVVTYARCRREATCGHVGTGRLYATQADCEQALVVPTRAEVGACLEYDGWMVDNCAQEIRALRCADPLNTVGVLTTCNMRRLCHVPE